MARRYFILQRAASYGIKLPKVGHQNFSAGVVYPVDDPWIAETMAANKHFAESDARGYVVGRETQTEKMAREAKSYRKMPKIETQVRAPEPVPGSGEQPRFVNTDPTPQQIAEARARAIKRQQAAAQAKTPAPVAPAPSGKKRGRKPGGGKSGVVAVPVTEPDVQAAEKTGVQETEVTSEAALAASLVVLDDASLVALDGPLTVEGAPLIIEGKFDLSGSSSTEFQGTEDGQGIFGKV